MRFWGCVGDEEYDVEVKPSDGEFIVSVDGSQHRIDAVHLEASLYSMIIDGRAYEVSVRECNDDTYAVVYEGSVRSVRLVDPLAAKSARSTVSGSAEIQAVMAGRVVKVLANEGEEISEGQGIIVLEAMKMENEVCATRGGTLVALQVEEGQTLETGELIARIE